MAETPFSRNVDRRKFINGRWSVRADENPPGTVEIASILVQTRPERLDAAAHAIGALAGTQIYSRDSKGKLVVVLEAENVGTIGETLNTITSMPDVLTAALVYHATDDG